MSDDIIAEPCYRLLQFLDERGTSVHYMDLPDELRSTSLICECERLGLIQIGTWYEGNPLRAVLESRDALVQRMLRVQGERDAPNPFRCVKITDKGIKALSEWRRRMMDASTEAGDVQPARQTNWTPPAGYVGRMEVCTDPRFLKNGKNPPATTIDGWVKSAKKSGDPPEIVKAPENQENHYPEAWVHARIRLWNPRKNATQHVT